MYQSVPLYLGTVLPLKVAHDNNIDGTRLLDVKICTQPSPIATFRPRPSACCARRYFQIGRWGHVGDYWQQGSWSQMESHSQCQLQHYCSGSEGSRVILSASLGLSSHHRPLHVHVPLPLASSRTYLYTVFYGGPERDGEMSPHAR